MKYIDLDALPWYTKQQVAEHQLDRAIKLLLDEQDAISSVTLAGAAEEILGTLAEMGGERHALGLLTGRTGGGQSSRRWPATLGTS